MTVSCTPTTLAARRITPRTGYRVNINRAHIALVISERRRLCIGEDVRIEPRPGDVVVTLTGVRKVEG